MNVTLRVQLGIYGAPHNLNTIWLDKGSVGSS